jgi:cytidylate kinase
MTQPLSIAIDGPVASGKSAVGRRLAEKLGIGFLDTGLMYRAVTLAAVKRGIHVGDRAALAELVNTVQVDAIVAEEGTRVIVDGLDVTDGLRIPEVEQGVSYVSQVAEVRQRMVEQQRAIEGRQPIVMVGRDIGTVVLPHASLKVYLDASLEERARRRHAEIAAKGESPTLAEIEDGLRERDRIDSSRDISPLRPAVDAHIINTDGLTVDEVVSEIERLIEP